MILIKLFTRKLEHYTGIEDLPIWNWFKINETNDLTYLLHKRRLVTVNEKEYLTKLFSNIYEDFTNTFGINETLQKVMSLKRDIAVLQLDISINGDTSRQTFIDIKIQELNDIIKNSENEKNTTVKAYLDKYMGFFIDEKKISVKDYYSYLELLKQEAKATEKHGRQN
jgi:hypothetical protein